MTIIIQVNNITFTYPCMSDNLLENISFAINSGECLAVLGNNGVGKSTLLKCINRICQVDSGSVLIDGQEVFKMRHRILAQHIAYVPQKLETNHMTVFDTILLGRKPYIDWDVTEHDREIVSELVTRMGLSEYALRDVSQLSGGEAQIVMLARALAQEPKVLLLDEPTSNLDLKNQHEVLKLIRQITEKKQICIALVIHDLNLAMQYCDKFLLLKDSSIYSYGGIEIITAEAISSVYGIEVEIFEHQKTKIIIAK